MNNDKDPFLNYSRDEFSRLFWNFTGENNSEDSVITVRGFKVFSWTPVFWPFIYNFPIEPEDVIIATFPKSGTTWMQQIVHLIVTQDFDAAHSVPIYKRAPFIELPRPAAPSTLANFAKQPPPRILKTHLPACLLPKHARRGKLIYVYRNAKDVAVSYFHHNQLFPQDNDQPYSKSFEEFAQDFLEGNVCFGPYPDHLKSYLTYKNEGNSILMLRYEDLKKDGLAAIRQIAKYLGKTLSYEVAERIFEATKFDSMKANPAANYSNVIPQTEGKNFIRKGVVGDWKTHFEENGQLSKNFDNYVETSLPKELVIRE